MAGVGHLKNICKDEFRVASAVQETSSSDMLCKYLQEVREQISWEGLVAVWCIRSSSLRRWFCITGAALCITWPHFFVAGAALYTDAARGRQRYTRLSIFEGGLAKLLRFWCYPLRNFEEVSQNFFFFDVVNFSIDEVPNQNVVLFQVFIFI